MENVLFKISFPAEFHAQTAVECAMRLHPLVRGRIDEIERIEIETQEAGVRIIDKTGPLANYADRDHCIQYMVAVPLILGRLTASDYNDDIAADPRIDALRAKMTVRENPQFTHDYFDPDKRYIGNSVQVFFTDGSSTDKVSIDYPDRPSQAPRRGHPGAAGQVRGGAAGPARFRAGRADHGAGRRPGEIRRDADRSVHESVSRVRSARRVGPISTVTVELTRSSQGRH